MKEIMYMIFGGGTVAWFGIWMYKQAKNAPHIENNEEEEIIKIEESDEMSKNRLKQELWEENYKMEQEITRLKTELQAVRDKIEPTHDNISKVAGMLHSVLHGSDILNWKAAELILDMFFAKII
jgi:predicted  nucleic acid-binding Zn-ribbon protein